MSPNSETWQRQKRRIARFTSGFPERSDWQFSSNYKDMNLSGDLREFIELLNSYDVEYVIVGAHSLAFHARPRYTGDLDIFVRPTPQNATKITAVLKEFGFGGTDKANPISFNPIKQSNLEARQIVSTC